VVVVVLLLLLVVMVVLCRRVAQLQEQKDVHQQVAAAGQHDTVSSH
jgi:hypothetical protein